MMVGLGWQHLNHKTENIKQIDAQQPQQARDGLDVPLGQDAESDYFSLKASPKIRRNMKKRREKKKKFLDKQADGIGSKCLGEDSRKKYS